MQVSLFLFLMSLSNAILLKGKVSNAIELLEKVYICHSLKVRLIYVIGIKEMAHPCHYLVTVILQNHFLHMVCFN